MALGTPLATGDADFECGTAGPFLLEVGISSSFHIAKFFGLTLNGARPMASAVPHSVIQTTPVTEFPELVQPQILCGEVLEEMVSKYPQPQPSPSRINIGAVIAKAFETAGLIPRR